MKKLFYILLIFALFAGFPRAAHADYNEGDRVAASVIVPLMQWVERETGVHVTRQPMVVTNRGLLLRVAARHAGNAGRPQALYVGGLVLVDHLRFDPTDATQLSLLVHELVHYAQSFRTNAKYMCEGEKEREAYTLQNKWLQLHGHAAFASASWIDRMAKSCPARPTTIAMATAR